MSQLLHLRPYQSYHLMLSGLIAALLASPLHGQGNPQLGKVPRLYALVVVDTESNLKIFLEQNRDNVTKVLKEAFERRPHRLQLTVLDGSRVSPDAVLS